ncbi:peptidase M23 [Arthrobacter crystallopoietes BAB-32]|uniref:Peptidase M23 n=1 Tax=Arthrobacter crystallopoietes BAB-32 TaxID=1246476 RepID=N1UU85_9MICC|nr:M23 family metallopeptidase [Arthrobacter crystallopoietes]EMY33991.1 peptidase M23 [Arthrobacter crystallopoietes BAB-32]
MSLEHNNRLGNQAVKRKQPGRKTCLPQGIISAALAAFLVLSVGAAGPVQADELDDRASELKQEVAEVEQSLEFLDADIIKTVTKLKEYQGQLPAAQEKLAAAQGRVAEAAGKVSALAQRVDMALQTKDSITRQLETDEAELEDTKKVIGQIATQAYKQGGVPSNLQLFLGSEGTSALDDFGLANQALRSQNAALDRLSQQNATNVNSQARLEAVEQEIRELKAQAEEALAAEQEARDEAAAEKEKVDNLIAETSALSDELQARKPQIQRQLAQVQEEQQQVQAEIAERQERLRREAEERRRKEEAERRAAQAAWEREQARIKAAQQAAASAGRPVPQIVPTVEPPPPASSEPSSFGLRYPVAGSVTSGYGWRATPAGTIDFGGTGGYMHTGIDFGAACGTPVTAPTSGTVATSGWGGAAGNMVIISHGVVGGNALDTSYFHLTRSIVSAGQTVGQGQVIGYVGTTGNSTGCHLHFETTLNGSLVNPMGLL